MVTLTFTDTQAIMFDVLFRNHSLAVYNIGLAHKDKVIEILTNTTRVELILMLKTIFHSSLIISQTKALKFTQKLQTIK